MSYQLVIAEKPSVARSIAGVIGADKKQDGYMEGNGYLVSWCIGHLVSLADAGTYDERFKKWRYDDLPILPQEWQYIIPDDKKKQFDTLRSLMERPDVTGLVCATDAGREGELIFRFVYRMAGCKKPFQRLWISSMEDAAIKDGFAHLKPGTDYDNLYQSALCRAQADWLVGINATRLFSILYHKTLTVGRVQTPTLKMLVDREAKISSFQKEKYHIVQIAAGGMEAASERMGNADDAKALKAACETAQAVCVSVTREKKTEQPPRLYDLTTLQREANRLFGFTAKQTLDYAQQLYEKKLLTYNYTPQIGDIVKVETADGQWEEFTVMGIGKAPNLGGDSASFYFPQELLPMMKENVSNFNITCIVDVERDQLTEVENKIFQLAENRGGIEVFSISDIITYLQEEMNNIKMPLYGLVFFIAVFGLISLINTLMTNIISRQQEFGILQSVGLSSKQFSKMLQTECFYYVSGTAILTLTIGTLTGFVLCKVFNQVGTFGTLTYHFPVLEISIYFVALFFILAAYSVFSVRYSKRHPVIERIKTME